MTELSFTVEGTHTFVLKPTDTVQLTPEQMWHSHWTRPYNEQKVGTPGQDNPAGDKQAG